MPFHDWQFWAVSIAAAWGLWIMARPFMPKRKSAGSQDAACPNCAASSAASKHTRRVALTIERKKL